MQALSTAADVADGYAAAQNHTHLVLQADVHLAVVTLQVVHQALSAMRAQSEEEPSGWKTEAIEGLQHTLKSSVQTGWMRR